MNIGISFFTAFGCLLFLGASALAQDVELDKQINESVNQAVNAVTLFTTRNSISSGNFRISNEVGSDSDLDITHVPYSYSFGDVGDGIVPSVSAFYGHSRAVQAQNVFPGEADDFSRLNTDSFGLGASVNLPVFKGLTLKPQFSSSYSHLKRRYDFNSAASAALLEQLDRTVFNTSIDVMTYSPSVDLEYSYSSEGVVVTFNSSYSHLFNNSISTKSDVIDVNSDTGLWQNSVEARYPTKGKVFDRSLKLRPFVVRSDIYGDARGALPFDSYYEAGLDFIFSSEASSNVLEEFLEHVSIGGSYVFGDEFRGLRFGITLGA